MEDALRIAENREKIEALTTRLSIVEMELSKITRLLDDKTLSCNIAENRLQRQQRELDQTLNSIEVDKKYLEFLQKHSSEFPNWTEWTHFVQTESSRLTIAIRDKQQSLLDIQRAIETQKNTLAKARKEIEELAKNKAALEAQVQKIHGEIDSLTQQARGEKV